MNKTPRRPKRPRRTKGISSSSHGPSPTQRPQLLLLSISQRIHFFDHRLFITIRELDALQAVRPDFMGKDRLVDTPTPRSSTTRSPSWSSRLRKPWRPGSIFALTDPEARKRAATAASARRPGIHRSKPTGTGSSAACGRPLRTMRDEGPDAAGVRHGFVGVHWDATLVRRLAVGGLERHRPRRDRPALARARRRGRRRRHPRPRPVEDGPRGERTSSSTWPPPWAPPGFRTRSSWGSMPEGHGPCSGPPSESRVARTVHVSSAGVIGAVREGSDRRRGDSPESAERLRPQQARGGEARPSRLRETGMMVVVVRPGWVYGPEDRRTFKVFKAIHGPDDSPWSPPDRGRQTPVFIDDLVDGIIRTRPEAGRRGEIYHLRGTRSSRSAAWPRSSPRPAGPAAATAYPGVPGEARRLDAREGLRAVRTRGAPQPLPARLLPRPQASLEREGPAGARLQPAGRISGRGRHGRSPGTGSRAGYRGASVRSRFGFAAVVDLELAGAPGERDTPGRAP